MALPGMAGKQITLSSQNWQVLSFNQNALGNLEQNKAAVMGLHICS
jgi:hypothetical protein